MPSSTGVFRVLALPAVPPSHSSYRDQIRQNVLVKQYFCDVDIAHLISYDEELAHKLTTEPTEIIPLVRIKSIVAVSD